MRTKTGKRVKTKRPTRRVQSRAKAAARNRSGKGSRLFGQVVLPLAISICIAICLGALGYLGYQKVTASNFFNVKRIDVVGIERASRPGIEAIVRTETERSGVWRSDIFELKAKIEKLPFVKTAAVTRVLPGGLRVLVTEKKPIALVLRGGKEYLVDSEGDVLAAAEQPEGSLPFAIIGWDETKSEKAMKDNIERVRIYQKTLAEWRAANLVSRVNSINLADLREPRAIVSDSGTTVSIAVGRENFGENLIKGIKAIVGKGNTFEAVNLVGSNMVLAPRKQNQ